MTGQANGIEVVGFMDLARHFRARGWKSPHYIELSQPIDGPTLLALVEVADEAVECLFVNHKAIAVADAVVSPGDRVALVPPGVPGPHRYSLGIWRRPK